MSEKMPNQEYLPLPEVQDKDLVDILSYEVIEDNNDSIKMELSINNPSGEQIKSIQVKEISSRIISQKYEDGKTTAIIELRNPIHYISRYSIMSITSQGALNLPFTRKFEDNERNIYVDFYKTVSTIEDWKQINNSPTENYRLINDLDFLNCGKEIIITEQYKGKIDGNGHTIKNIRIPQDAKDYGLIYKLDGEIKNLNVENYFKENPTNSQYLGFISLAYSNAVVDNVHLKNERFSSSIVNGSNMTGGLIASGSDLIIRNCSVTGITINLIGDLNNARAGGLVGYGSNVRIDNCFVQDLDINTKGALIYYGIGGLIGRDSGGIVKYCYTTGNIKTDAENTGGIYGFTTGKVENCYSLVNIMSQTDYVGGIGGYDNNTSVVSTFKNLYLGNIYSAKQSNYVNRIQGNTTTEEENYAYIGQKINGFIRTEDLGAQKLLTNSEIFDINTYKQILEFKDEYNYDGLDEGILPKLYNTDGLTILPNQKDNKIGIEAIFIEEIEAEKADVNTARARVVVNNPSGVELTGVTIEYANVQVSANVFDNGKTYIDLIITPEKAYDSYTISNLLYMENGEEKSLSTQAKLNIQFYNEINNFEDWQKIDSESAQNYRLNTDIDFSGKINPKINVSIGRLEAEGNGHTLKNLEVNLNGAAKGFIKEIKNSLKNITFENITVNNTAKSGNYTGLIVRNTANIDNVTFKDITVNASKMSYVGTIANNSAISIKDVELQNITVSANQYVGGFLGITDSGIFQYINVNGANITAASNYSGSVIGKITARDIYRISDITANDVNVKGVNYTGGILGQGRAQNFTITNSNIEGVSYVGGAVGVIDYHSSDNRNFLSENCTITGTGNYIGGIAGELRQVYAAFSVNNNINGKGNNATSVGGISGVIYNELRESGAIGTTIKNEGRNSGGIVGYLSGAIYYSYSCDCTVEANQNAGGIVGEYRSGYLGYCYNNNTVTAYANGAGGVVGFLNNKDMTGANYTSRVYQSYVAGAKITAPTEAGGLIGRIVENLYDSRYYYSNYVEAYINCNTTLVSLGVGGDKEQNNAINKFYVYEKSTINNQVVTTNVDNIKSENFITRDDLYQRQTYTKIGLNSYYDFSKISQGKYPLVQVSNRIIARQEGIDFPPAQVQAQLRTLNKVAALFNLNKNVSLPKVNIYATGANLVNIELEDTGSDLLLKYTPQGQEEKTIEIDEKVYTFKYDYQTKVDLILTNGLNSQNITIIPNEVANEISLINGKTYSLNDDKIYKEDEILEGEFVNLYKEFALGKNGKIYNIETGKWEDDVTKGFVLQEESTSIESNKYGEVEIETYANFTVVKNGEQETEKEGKILVKDGEISVIDTTLENNVNGEIINKYNGNEYQTILNKDGKLCDLKTPLTYPENFINKNIKSITTNSSNEPYVTVEYESGKVITFDYTTGEIIFDNNVKEDISLIDYIKNSLSLGNVMESVIENSNEEYQKSVDLKETLQVNPIETVLQEISSNDNTEQTETIKTNEKYVTAYDNKNKEYVVYKESELLNVEKEEYQSENSKISQSAELTKYYGAQKQIEKQTNGLVWIVPTIVATIISLVILIRRNIRKNRQC